MITIVGKASGAVAEAIAHRNALSIAAGSLPQMQKDEHPSHRSE
jgi:hypothetical protein